MTSNNTIAGTQWPGMPDAGDRPLVVDASSDILSRPIDVAGHGLIYAGAQKNLGPAGVTVVIIRPDLAERGPSSLPKLLRYATYVKGGSRPNTPPVFAIYVVSLVTAWLRGQGGLEAAATRNERKAAKLYAAIDRTDFYRGVADPDSRSRMNVTFRLPMAELEQRFAEEAEAAGLSGLKGHRSVGGLRASIYNAFPEAGVDALATFMAEFERDIRVAGPPATACGLHAGPTARHHPMSRRKRHAGATSMLPASTGIVSSSSRVTIVPTRNPSSAIARSSAVTSRLRVRGSASDSQTGTSAACWIRATPPRPTGSTRR